MTPADTAALFSNANGKAEAEQYLEAQGLLATLKVIEQQSEGRLPPDWRDLARLHAVVRGRRVFTILEFGIGYSTLAMADALAKNHADWNVLAEKPRIRNSTPFQLHAVDTEPQWIDLARSNLPGDLAPYVRTHHSSVTAGLFQGRDCHFYDQLPNVVPDFIYLDGPDPAVVVFPPASGEQQKSGWTNPDRVVMAADLLRMESWLLPGTAILVDGRTANVRFLMAHFYRHWVAARSTEGDVTLLELQEAPLGPISLSTMHYCLGRDINQWTLGM